jgi:quinol monooxygenase YgiN
LRTPVYASDPSNKGIRAPSPTATKGHEHRPPPERRAQAQVRRRHPKEPGCNQYSLLEERKQTGRFLTFETWADQAHTTTPAIKAAGRMFVPILAKPFTQEFLKMVSER